MRIRDMDASLGQRIEARALHHERLAVWWRRLGVLLEGDTLGAEDLRTEARAGGTSSAGVTAPEAVPRDGAKARRGLA